MLFIKHTEVMNGLVAIVEIEGPLNGFTSQDFEDYIYQLLNKNICFILINGLKLEYISSEGIGLMLLLQKKISEENGFVVLFNLSDEILSIYEILGFDKIFRIATSESEAMQIMDKQIEIRGTPRRVKVNNRNHNDETYFEKSNSHQDIPTYVVECSNCKTLIRIKESGDFMCPSCRADFSVTPDRTVVFQ